MAKKFVRGVTGVDDIEKFDKSLTNVNDLISDGQDTYVHTKKGKNEFYYKVTDGVTSVKSTDNTITVEKSDDGTVSLKTNPQKVLQHDNLKVDYGISKTTSGNTTNLSLEYSLTPERFDLNNLENGNVRTWKALNAPKDNYWFFVSSFKSSLGTFQEATTIIDGDYKKYERFYNGTVWSQWSEQVTSKSSINDLLAQKQNKLTAGDGLEMVGDTITLKTFDGYSSNLNNLTYSCIAKPVDNTPNLPKGVAGNGILSSLRVGDVVIQKYHPFTGNQLYIRSCTGLPNSPKWRDWTLLS